MADIFCAIAMLFVGGILGVITMCLCMAGKDADTDNEPMDQAHELLNLRLENEYLHMWQEEVRDKVDKMEPPDGFPQVYCRGWYDVVEEIRRIVE